MCSLYISLFAINLCVIRSTWVALFLLSIVSADTHPYAPMAEFEGMISVAYEGRSLQMRRDQLTIEVLSKVFRLVPETVLLVSNVGTIATAEDGVFKNVDALYAWTVEGDRVTSVSSISSCGLSETRRPSLRLKHKPGSSSTQSSSERWKPQPYGVPATSDQQRTRHVSVCVCVCVCACVRACACVVCVH